MLVYRFEGVPRNPLVVAIKNVLTLGIHTKLWLYRVNREMDGREGFHINLHWLAVMLWLPIVTPAIVKFQTAYRLNQMVADPVTIPIIRARWLGRISLVPVIGAGFYAYWVQSTLNKYWFWHRRKERVHLLTERIKELAAEVESDAVLKKRFEHEEEARRLEREMEEEIEAVRLRWGDERFLARKERADLRAKRGRLTRKQMQEVRRKEREQRRQRRIERRRERSLIARYMPRRADPEKPEQWEPTTPLPRRTPEEILAVARKEDREPTRKEEREVRRAKRLLAAREKETKRLEKRRARLLARVRRKEARLEANATKRQAAKQKKREKAAQKDTKKRQKKGPGKEKKKEKKKGKEDPGVALTPEADAEPEPEPAGPPPLRRRLWVLPPVRDPEVEAHWEPRTPEPGKQPEEIEAAIAAEGREPTKKERKRIARAERLLSRREKEEEKLEDLREKARAKAARRKETEAAKKEKQEKRLAAKNVREEAKAGRKRQRAAKKKGAGKGKRPKKDKPAKAKKLPVKSRKGTRRSPERAERTAATGDGRLSVLTVRCPRCKNEVEVRKVDDRPAKLACPSCGLVGKV